MNGKAKVILILSTTLWTLIVAIGAWEIQTRSEAISALTASETLTRERVSRLEAQYEHITESLSRIEGALEKGR